MNILIIYAHPQNPSSFNQQICATVKTSAGQAGHAIEVRDLYALEFNPVLAAAELSAKQPSADVLTEQEFIHWADMLVFIYPLWWGGMPAIMHGYLDRIFSYGFAYTSGTNGSVGLLGNKRIVLVNTIGARLEHYQQNGMINALETIANPGIFNFCGTSVEKFFHFTAIHSATPIERQQMLVELHEYILNCHQYDVNQKFINDCQLIAN